MISNEGVTLVQMVGPKHGPIFSEFIELLSAGLQQLGIPVEYATNRLNPKRLNLICGATVFLTPASLVRLQASGVHYVVFQSEALDERHGFLPRFGAYLEFLLKAPEVWDYSVNNLAFLEARGHTRTRYIPLGYASCLERIIPVANPDIDVLFYGALSPRRKRVLEELQARGARTIALIGTYGRERDAAIARSKIVLNLHQFDIPHLEQLRIAYLLNNRRFVVSEVADINLYGSGIVFSPYDDIVECCLSFLGPDRQSERTRIGEEGYRQLQALPMLSALQTAMEPLLGKK